MNWIVPWDMGPWMGLAGGVPGAAQGAALAGGLFLAVAAGFMARRRHSARLRERLARERERRILAERAEMLMREANDPIFLLDMDGRILEANARASTVYGFSAGEFAGRSAQDLRAPSAAPAFPERIRKIKAQESGVWETLHRRKDGSTFPVEASARVVSVGGETYILTFLRDITERHIQAREIRHLTQLYAALGQIGHAVVWTRDRDGLFRRICDVLVEFGRLRTAWIARVDPGTGEPELVVRRGGGEGLEDPWEEPASLRAVVDTLRPSLRTSHPGGPGSAIFPVAQGGKVTHLLGVASEDPGFFGPGEMQLLEETALDLSFALDKLDEASRRARAEDELQTARAFAEALLDTANAIVVHLDERGDILLINDAATEITGYAREELLGRNWFEVLVPRDRFPDVWELFKNAKQGGVIRRFENPILTKDGQEKIISWQNGVIQRKGAMAGTLSFGIEVTQQRHAVEEQKRLEAQLHQSQRLESLGMLAGGVAHDLNNVLGAILSLASARKAEPGDEASMASALDTIVNACLRGRGVVKSLLYFARKDLVEERPLDLNAMVHELAQLLSHTTLKRVRVDLDLEPALPALLGDGGALSHAVMNLCVNSVDAMPRGGTLSLRTRLEADGSLSLEVRDTGEGMAPEVLRKALEPFFTTKPVGKGTGLGLSMAFSTLKAHGGTLELQSAPGQGTTATLRFPAARAGGAPPTPAPGPSRPRASGRALSILLVDDDELIREAVAPVLETLGHGVQVAAGGQEALDLLRNGLSPDVVILDMNMPGLTGAQTLPRILEMRPEQRVIMASGYSDQAVAGLLEGRPRVRSLRKPFSLAEMRACLEDLAP